LVRDVSSCRSTIGEQGELVIASVIRDRRHARWLQQARSGDTDAFGRLYDELLTPVADYLARRVASPQDAEDLVATVFHRMLKNLARFDPSRGSALGWALTIARHALIDHLRQTRDTVPVEDLAEILAGSWQDPLEGLIRTEMADRILARLDEMPAATREIVALHYTQGLRLREIGDLLGLGEDAVKQRLSRARRELRDHLRAKEVDHETKRPGAASARNVDAPAAGR
jgi:RNA polymerase sigma-70 factor (ECF subfamily)